jgi:hypothetical protein
MKSMIRVFGLGLGLLVAACAQEPPPGGEFDALAARPASSLAVQIERAERTLDRGTDARQARASLEAALQDPGIAPEERRQALLALSRALEAVGDREQAIAVVEQEIAARGNDRAWESRPFDARLRKLLTGSESSPGPALNRAEGVAPFAHVVARYFPAAADGSIKASMYLAGGESRVSDELGTFNIRGAVRADKEKACPLCEVQVNVSKSVRQSDWLVIPQSQDKLDSALAVFYFDLGRNRIPARYERHLPMKVADIEAELERGKSFVVAKERPGAPPALLLAAPRTAMLDDVERHLASLDHLPIAVEMVDVSPALRPVEIQAVVRGTWFGEARRCYDALLARDAEAEGKLVLRFHIAAEGAMHDLELETESTALRDPELLACVRHSLEATRFPASGKETTVAYPVVMTPD